MGNVMDLLNRYYLYLLALGYEVHSTRSNNNSISAYVEAVKTVADWEGLSIDDLVKQIDRVILLYKQGGAKHSLVSNSKGRIENGLIHFKEFLEKKI